MDDCVLDTLVSLDATIACRNKFFDPTKLMRRSGGCTNCLPDMVGALFLNHGGDIDTGVNAGVGHAGAGIRRRQTLKYDGRLP
jgi:hypothetical protein